MSLSKVTSLTRNVCSVLQCVAICCSVLRSLCTWNGSFGMARESATINNEIVRRRKITNHAVKVVRVDTTMNIAPPRLKKSALKY